MFVKFFVTIIVCVLSSGVCVASSEDQKKPLSSSYVRQELGAVSTRVCVVAFTHETRRDEKFDIYAESESTNLVNKVGYIQSFYNATPQAQYVDLTTRNMVNEIPKKSWIESLREISGNMVKKNPLVNIISWVACGYYTHELCRLFGTPLYTPLIFGYQAMGALIASRVYGLSHKTLASKEHSRAMLTLLCLGCMVKGINGR